MGHLDHSEAGSVAVDVFEDAGNRRCRGLVAREQNLARFAGRVLDAAAVRAAPARSDDQQLIADGCLTRPGRRRTGEPGLEVQHEVDHDSGAALLNAQLPNRVGAHRAALLLGNGEERRPPVAIRVLEVGKPARTRREDQLDALVEDALGVTELIEVRAAERDAREARREQLDRANSGARHHERRRLDDGGFNDGHGASPWAERRANLRRDRG